MSTTADDYDATSDDEFGNTHANRIHQIRSVVDGCTEQFEKSEVNGVLLAERTCDDRWTDRLHSMIRLRLRRRVAGSVGQSTRPLFDEDLLGRPIVCFDSEVVDAMLRGARIAVTGAGGSIGSELARQLAALAPSCLLLIDHDDSLLHAAQCSIPADQQSPCHFVLGDIRDVDRLDQLFGEFRPEVVFHAAALKHVPALETSPSEGWKTNVLGTSNVIAAARRADVTRLVNISTDKAVQPINVLGFTKKIAERMTSFAALETGRNYVSVRFGNVIGSRGSVVQIFERQIAAGGPVTVTHPDMQRYFMSVREAVRLTLQAAAIGDGGHVLVLDMGEPVRIVDVAQRLIDRRGGGVGISFCGLRPGERLAETLLGADDQPVRDRHPMIDQLSVAPLDLHQVLLERYQASGGRTLQPPATMEEFRCIAELPASTGNNFCGVPLEQRASGW